MNKKVPAVVSDVRQSLAYRCKDIMPHLTDKKKPIGCPDNLKILLNILNVNIHYNVISKEVEIAVPDIEFSTDNYYNASLAYIAGKMKEIEMSTAHYTDFMTLLCDANQFNPVELWVTSKKWDGNSRLQEFFNTVKARDEAAKEAFIYRWMLGAIACACSPKGADQSGILVLQGAQDLGKTWWFRKLVPESTIENYGELTRSDASLDASNKDSVEQLVCHWLVELGELDDTFRRSANSALKSFITRPHDTYRKSFDRRKSKYPRRTAFMASVNDWIYLGDKTGNRRYWTIECLSVDSYHTIDMQQVWAEIYEKWLSGEDHRLTPPEKDLLQKINADHENIEPIEELLLAKYDFCSDRLYWRWISATEILRELGFEHPDKYKAREAATYIRKHNGNDAKDSNGRRLLRVPPKRDSEWNQ